MRAIPPNHARLCVGYPRLAEVLWLFGEVTYIDAFGVPRFNRFRLNTGAGVAARYHKFFWADTGNEAN